MKRYIVIIFIIIALAVLSVGVIYVIKSHFGRSSSAPSSGSLPVASSTASPSVPSSSVSSNSGGVSSGSSATPPASAPTGSTFVIGTSQGGVTVNNFYNHPAMITQDQQTVVIDQNTQYGIAYNVGDSSFTIAILSLPFSTSRHAAESAFLKALGVSEQSACKLKVYEGVPSYVSQHYSGKVFPLSFCASSSSAFSQ